MRKILMTGANGFLGKRIFKELVSNEMEVVSLGRSANSNIISDISLDIPEIADVDMVVHCAGKAHMIPKTEAERQQFYNINVLGTQNLLNSLSKSPPSYFIFISSVAVYGVENGANISEKHPLNALDPYGLSKIQAEKIIENWCAKNNVICGILRLPLLVGANPPGNLGAMIKGIRKGYYFNIAGGTARKSMVMAEDVAKILPKLVETGGVYNLTDGYHPNFKELSKHIASQLGKKYVSNMPKTIALGLAKIGDLLPKFPLNSKKLHKITADLTFNDDKARSVLGWSPRSVLDAFKI